MHPMTRSVLAEMTAGFESRGWDPADLTSFRMQMAPEALEGAPAGEPDPSTPPADQGVDPAGSGSSTGDEGTQTPPAGGAERDPATGKFVSKQQPADEGDPDGSGFEDIDYDALVAAAETGGTPVSPDQLRKLAGEHKAYRQKFGPVAQAFKGYHEEDARALTQFVADFANPEKRTQAAAWMREVLDRLTPAQQQKLEADVKAAQGAGDGQQPPAEEEEFDPYDPAQIDARVQKAVEARLAEQDKQREVQAEHEKLIARGKELGYTPDPRDPDWATVLFIANSQFPGDPDALGRAHKVIEDRLNAKVTAILEQKRQDAHVPVTPQGGQPPSGATPPRTMQDAEKSAAARLDEIFRNGPQR